MRNAFAQEITRLAQEDERIVLLSGDIGNRLFNRFIELAPRRFHNCGVAEANMAGVAAGLAHCGFRPVTYTIAPFNTLRCLEQIKIDICYHNLPVVIVGTGAGLSYSSLGPTHHSCDDIGVLRTLPNIAVAAPADSMELRALLRGALRRPHPTYLRIGKKGEPDIHPSVPELALGQGILLREGGCVCLINTGTTLAEARQAAEALAASGVSAALLHLPTLKPLDDALLARACATARLLVTVEEHGPVGGLGSAVADWMCQSGAQSVGKRLLRISAPDAFLGGLGGQAEARERLGLDARAIAAAVRQALRDGVPA